MKIAKHICFFYKEERFQYINKILQETNKYPFTTDIFIHTNEKFSRDKLIDYTNGNINIVVYKIETNEYVSCVSRNFIKTLNGVYDIFMYIEDDILVPTTTLNYWLIHKDQLLKHNYNLGFERIEIISGKEYTVDLGHRFDNPDIGYLTKKVEINTKSYILNDMNTYCAFWIYDKDEFNKFVNSMYYDIKNIVGYLPRESCAIGLHGMHTNFYKGTLIPLLDNRLHENCKVYHLNPSVVDHFSKMGWWFAEFKDSVRIKKK